MRGWMMSAGMALAMLAGTSLGQEGAGVAAADAPEADRREVSRTSVENAALLYYRYWMIGGDWIREGLGDWTNEAGSRPDEALAKALEDEEALIHGLLKAATIERADWGIEYEAGIGALLPHLGKLRLSARVLSADARRLLDAGQGDAAAERIAAIYRMSNHVRGDKVLISALVGNVLVSYANQEVDEIIASELLTVNGQNILLMAMESIPLDDIGGVRGAFVGERDIFLAWVRENFKGPGAGARVRRELAPLTQQSMSSVEEMALSMMDGEALGQDLDKASRFYDDVMAVWDLPDAPDRLRQLGELIANRHYGVMGKLLLPAFDKAWENSNKVRLELQKAIERVRGAKVVVKDE